MNIYNNFIKILKPVVERFPLVAIAIRFIRDNRQLLNEPKTTPMGFKLIGNSAMEQGMFEPDETKIIKRILKGVDIFIDVGANIGYYCCLALRKNKHTVAFEPIGTNLRYLYKNVKANGWEEMIEIFPLALSNKVGVIEIFGGGTGASLIKGWAGITSKYSSSVPTTTIDNILGHRFRDRSCFILVDIEGAEKLFLEGATSFLLRTPKPIWMVEISVAEHQPEGVSINPDLLATFQIFWGHDYEAWTADGAMRLVSPDVIQRIIKEGKNTLGTHNFLFIERGKMDTIMGSI